MKNILIINTSCRMSKVWLTIFFIRLDRRFANNVQKERINFSLRDFRGFPEKRDYEGLRNEDEVCETVVVSRHRRDAFGGIYEWKISLETRLQLQLTKLRDSRACGRR